MFIKMVSSSDLKTWTNCVNMFNKDTSQALMPLAATARTG